MNLVPGALLSQFSTSDMLMSASAAFAVGGLAVALLVVFLVAEEFVLYWRRELRRSTSARARVRRG